VANDETTHRRFFGGTALLFSVFGGLLLILAALAVFSRTSWAGPTFAPITYLSDQFALLLAGYLVEPARAGEALTPSIRFEQPWPQGLALLVAIVAIVGVVWLYRREGNAPGWYRMSLAALRIGLVLLTMLMLAEVVLSVERTGLPYFIIMTDDSASTRIVDQYGSKPLKDKSEALAKAAGKPEATRLAVAQGWLLKDDARLIEELRKQHKVKLYLVSNAARPLAEIDTAEQVQPALEQLLKVEPAGSQTRLGDGVRQVLTELRGVPPTAILLLTDGETTDGEGLAKAAEFARTKNVPLYTVGLGDSEPTRDLELTDLLVDDVVFVDDNVRFAARLQGRGFAGQNVTVKLQRRPQGSKTAVEDVESVQVTVPPDGQAARVEITHKPKQTGDVDYIVSIDPLPRELQTENNRIERTINVREEKLRVLLVDGEPRYEYRYLKSFLERDKTIDLSVVLQSSDPEYSEQDRVALPTFPAAKDGKEGLFNYDVVIFGDVDISLLSASQMQNLVEFVTLKGGGLLFIAGEHFNPLSYKGTPLEPLLPILLAEARDPVASAGVAIANFRPALTVEGRSHPIFRFGQDDVTSNRIWAELPELNWYLEAPRKQPAAFVLATHPSLVGSDGPLPLILYQFSGAGKTMMNNVDDTWRWRFRVGDRYFGRFWIQTIRFLARSKLLGQRQAEITTDRHRYQRAQPILISVRFPNPGLAPATDQISVQVRKKGQGPRKLTLKRSSGARNIYEGALPQATEGEYDVRYLPPPVLEGPLPTTSFRVDAPAGEFEEVRMNRPELLRAAETSQGTFHTPEVEPSALLKELPVPQKVPLDTDPPIPLWNTPAMLALFLSLLILEWVLRKRKQMA
jgi:hypothetical protein